MIGNLFWRCTNDLAEGLAADLKKVRRQTQSKAFTVEERDAILAAITDDCFCFLASPVRHSYYLDYIRTLRGNQFTVEAVVLM